MKKETFLILYFLPARDRRRKKEVKLLNNFERGSALFPFAFYIDDELKTREVDDLKKKGS